MVRASTPTLATLLVVMIGFATSPAQAQLVEQLAESQRVEFGDRTTPPSFSLSATQPQPDGHTIAFRATWAVNTPHALQIEYRHFKILEVGATWSFSPSTSAVQARPLAFSSTRTLLRNRPTA